jgi:hypothetical protein
MGQKINIFQRLRSIHRPHRRHQNPHRLRRPHLGHVWRLHLVLLRTLHRHRLRLPAHLRSLIPSLVDLHPHQHRLGRHGLRQPENLQWLRHEQSFEVGWEEELESA